MASLMKKIEQVPTGSLKQYPNNPRRGNVAVIAESLRRNEQFAPIVVQASTSYVLSGNHTLQAAQQLGWTEIDAVVIDVDDDRARRIMLAANHTADVAEYDNDALVELLTYLDGDYDGTGYTDDDVEDLRKLTEPPDLDALAGDIGEPGEDDGWPVIRFKVPPHVAAAWRSHLDTHTGDEAAAFAALLEVDPNFPADVPWQADRYEPAGEPE